MDKPKGKCVGEINAFKTQCEAITEKDECESFMKQPILGRDGVCDWKEMPDKPIAKCEDTEDASCTSMCMVDDMCCPSENLMMDMKSGDWMCCKGEVKSDNGKQVCTAPDMADKPFAMCEDTEDASCTSACMVGDKCCPSE